MMIRRTIRFFMLLASMHVIVGFEPGPASTLNDPAPIELRDLAGQPHTPTHSSDARGMVIFYLMTDCPISNAYTPEIQNLIREYSTKRIQFYVVYTDSELGVAKMQKHTDEFQLDCPILVDPLNHLIDRHRIETAPQAIFTDNRGRTLYHGRIDDLYTNIGKRKAKASERYLANAIEMHLADKPIQLSFVAPIGCQVIRSNIQRRVNVHSRHCADCIFEVLRLLSGWRSGTVHTDLVRRL